MGVISSPPFFHSIPFQNIPSFGNVTDQQKEKKKRPALTLPQSAMAPMFVFQRGRDDSPGSLENTQQVSGLQEGCCRHQWLQRRRLLHQASGEVLRQASCYLSKGGGQQRDKGIGWNEPAMSFKDKECHFFRGRL